MALQLVFGNAGSGKSHRIYRDLIEESIRYPRRNYLVLVPEQSTMQTQKELGAAASGPGLLNVDVLSFKRLAFRFFRRQGARSSRCWRRPERAWWCRG